MTGYESRKLKPGDRVRWTPPHAITGTILDRGPLGVAIRWDDSEQPAFVHHGDMVAITREEAKQ